MEGGNNSQCSAAGAGAGSGSESRPVQRQGQAQNRVQEVFGDTHLGAVMLVLMILHLLQYAMRDPCTC